MENDASVFLITGMPGAGKTTVSQLLADSVPRSARVAADDVQGLLRRGGVWPLGAPRREAQRQLQLCHRNIAALTNNFVADGFTTVIDCVLETGEDLTQLRGDIGTAIQLVVLAPGAEACRARNLQRDPTERFDFDNWAHLDANMRTSFGHLGLWLNTLAMTPAETVTVIRSATGHTA